MSGTELVAAVHRQLVDDGMGVDAIGSLVAARAPLLTAAERADIARRVAARTVGLGVIDDLRADASVSEIMVNGPGRVWVERDGAIEATEIEIDRPELDLLIERITAPLGRSMDPHRPWIDGRLADGSRVSIVGRPVALDGPYLTIRRFTLDRPALAAFAPPAVVATLEAIVDAGSTVVVSGGTGAGKTSLLNALATRLPVDQRVITVEDAAELALPHPHVVRLECRPAGTEGVGAVDVRDLVRTALRMRPDRLVLGEVRGPEAFDLMQAFNTGHRGGWRPSTRTPHSTRSGVWARSCCRREWASRPKWSPNTSVPRSM
ncbi:MAG: ATPase, T2SS/T4P/T4SS family [Acidimicrobiales bacterium]